MQSIPSPDWWRPDPTFESWTPLGLAAGRLPIGVACGSLLAFTIVLVLSPQDFFPRLGVLRPAMLTAGVAGAAHAMDRWQARVPSEPVRREVVFAALLLAWAVVTAPFSYWPGGSASILMTLYIKALVVFWLIGRVVDRVDRLRLLMWTLAIATVPLAVTGLHHYVTGAFMPDARGRIEGYGQGLASNPNDLALTLDLFIPLAIALAMSAGRTVTRAIAVAIVAVDVAAVVVTFSRGGFVVLAAIGVLVMVWLATRRAWVVSVAAMVAALAAAPLVPASYADRLATMSSVDADPTGSAQARWRDTRLAIGYVEAHPLVGAGIGMDYLALNDLRGQTWRSVHNAYLNYGVDLGLPGLVLFVSLFAASLASARAVERQARRVEQSAGAAELAVLARGIWIALLAFGVAGFFYPVAYQFYFYYLAGLAVALGTIARRQGWQPWNTR